MLPYCGFHISNIMLAPMSLIIPGCFRYYPGRPGIDPYYPTELRGFRDLARFPCRLPLKSGFRCPQTPDLTLAAWRHFRMRIFFFLSTQGRSIPIPLRGFEPPLPTFDPKSRACFYRSRSPRNRRTLNRKRATMQNSVNLVYFQPGLTM